MKSIIINFFTIIFMINLIFSLYSCDYKSVGIPGPDSTFYLNKQDYILKDFSEISNFTIKSMKVGENGITKLKLKIDTSKSNDSITSQSKFKLLTVDENQLSRIFSAIENTTEQIDSEYYLDYDLYGYSYGDKIYVVFKEKPFEIIELKHGLH